MSFEGYQEALESQKEKESEVQRLQEKYEQEMKVMRKELEPLLELKSTLMKEGLLKEPIP